MWAVGDHPIKLSGSLYPGPTELTAEGNVLYQVLSVVKALAEDVVEGLNARFDTKALALCRLFMVFKLHKSVGLQDYSEDYSELDSYLQSLPCVGKSVCRTSLK